MANPSVMYTRTRSTMNLGAILSGKISSSLVTNTVAYETNIWKSAIVMTIAIPWSIVPVNSKAGVGFFSSTSV